MTCERFTRTAPSSAWISRKPASPAVSQPWSSCSLSLARRSDSAPPAWKPRATRRGLSSSDMAFSVLLGGLDDLGQDPTARGGVQEGDARGADAGARRLIDQPQAAVAQRGQGRL